MRVTISMNFDGGEDEQRECVVIHQRDIRSDESTDECPIIKTEVLAQWPLSVDNQSACVLEDVREGDIITFA